MMKEIMVEVLAVAELENLKRVADASYKGFYGHDDEVQYDRNNSRFSHTSAKTEWDVRRGISKETSRR